MLLGLVNNILLARILGADKFGYYQLLLSWLAIGSVTGISGMSVPVLKAAVKGYDRFYWVATKKSFTCATAFSFIFGIIGCIGWVINDYGLNEVSLLLILISAGIPISAFQNYESFFVGKRRFKVARVIQAWTNVLVLLSTIVAAVFFDNGIAVYLAYLIARVVMTYCAVKIIDKTISMTEKNPILESQLMSQGWRQGAMNLIFVGSNNLEKIYVGAMSPIELGFYTIAILLPTKLKDNIKFILNIIASRWGQLDSKSGLLILRKRANMLILTGIVLFVLTSFTLPILIPLLFGGEYLESINIGIIYSLAIIPIFYNYLVGSYDQIQNNGRYTQFAQILKHVFSAIGIIAFGNNGVYWIVGSTVASEYLLFVMNAFYLKLK